MAKHVNEYDPSPTNRQGTRRIQEDTMKLKFNNIQSCIAACICVYHDNIGTHRGNPGGNGWQAARPSRVQKLVGIHFNTINLDNNEAEINTAMQQLHGIAHKRFDVYLVGPYDRNYAGSAMGAKFKTLGAENVYVYNFNYRGGGADIDVKMENGGNRLNVYYRDHVIAGNTLKAKYDPARGGTAPTRDQWMHQGVGSYENDRANKPWQPIMGFRRL